MLLNINSRLNSLKNSSFEEVLKYVAYNLKKKKNFLVTNLLCKSLPFEIYSNIFSLKEFKN